MRAEALLDLKDISKREKNVRRRNLQAVTIEAPVEVRDKLKGRVHKLMAVMISLVLVVVTGAVLIKYYAASFAIEHVVIEGEFHNEQAQAIEQSLKPYMVGDLFTVDLLFAHKSLMSLPWIEDVRLQRSWPNKVIVRIQEQVPVGRWNIDALVNAKGEIFSTAYGVDRDSLPMLKGPESKTVEVLNWLTEFQKLLAEYHLDIKELAVDERNSWTLTTQNKVTIRLGRQHIESRLKRFLLIMQADLKTDWSRIETVDLRHSNGFAVSWLSEQDDRQG